MLSFIMATTEHAKIPKTISSRCQDFDFRHLEDEKIIERLQLIANEEEVSADADALALITRQSEGCLRDAEKPIRTPHRFHWKGFGD